MVHYKLVVSYKGTHFYGWQKQKGNRVTVQSHLEECLLRIYKGDGIKTLASGRTDAGVHAIGQVVGLGAPWHIPCKDLKKRPQFPFGSGCPGSGSVAEWSVFSSHSGCDWEGVLLPFFWRWEEKWTFFS